MMVVFDVVECILLRSDVKDLIPWKVVCKSWYSLISSPCFAKAHLKHTCNNNDSSNTNNELGHVKIAMPTYWKIVKIPNESLYQVNVWKVVGSSNGLVCISRFLQDGLILVNNPWTREVRKLPMAPILPEKVIGYDLCLSFGYDASTDDYKVVMGIKISNTETLIQVLSLKSNTWKTIGQFKFILLNNKSGILFNGAFYWIALTRNNEKTKNVILSFDLSREDFTIIPRPKQRYYRTSLGIAENQLCYFSRAPLSTPISDYHELPRDIWVMRSYNVEQSWELLPNNYEMKHEVVHYMKMIEYASPKNTRMSFFCDDNKCVSRPLKYATTHRFVPSLVSPYVNSGRPSHPTNDKTIVNAWCIEVAEGECQAKRGKFFEASEKIEKTYRREVGEAENKYFHEDVHLQENRD